MLAEQDKMTNRYIPLLEELAPDSGCYLNEGNFRQPNWQQAFYGANYDKLLRIKDKYDPHGLFYAVTAVGSDRLVAYNDGHLCKA